MYPKRIGTLTPPNTTKCRGGGGGGAAMAPPLLDRFKKAGANMVNIEAGEGNDGDNFYEDLNCEL